MTQEISSRTNQNRINATFQQKSAAVSLFALSTLGIYFFVRAIELGRNAATSTAGSLPEGFIGLGISVLVLFVIVEIVLQTVLVIGAGEAPQATERERAATLRATRNAYFLLAAGALATFASLVLAQSPFLTANLALFSLLLAEIVRLASQLTFSRKSS